MLFSIYITLQNSTFPPEQIKINIQSKRVTILKNKAKWQKDQTIRIAFCSFFALQMVKSRLQTGYNSLFSIKKQPILYSKNNRNFGNFMNFSYIDSSTYIQFR